jgi:glycosyltransferase involved in cell wall biosynthesis
MKKIIFINWHDGTNLHNGPVNAFSTLVKGLENSNYKDVEVVSPETFNNNFYNAVKYLIKSTLSNTDVSMVVNGNGLKMPYIVFLLSIFRRKREFYFISHGLRAIEDKFISGNYKAYHFFEKIIIKHFKKLIAVSEMLKQQIVDTYNRKKPIEVIYNGINTEDKYKNQSLPLSKDLKIIMSGGMKKIKGIEETIKLVNTINKLGKPYKLNLDIYGAYDDEGLFNSVNSLICENEQCAVCYKGKINKEDLFSLYGKYHFSIALSYSDTFNMAVAESILCGTPSLVSSNCGIAEIMENYKHGFIIDMSGNYIEATVNFLDKIFRDEALYVTMRRMCLDKEQELSIDNMTRRYMEVLKND